MISSLVDTVLHALDDAITPAAYWVQAGLPLMILCQHWPYLILVTLPEPILPNFPLGKKSIKVYGKGKFSLTLNDEETVKTAVISPEVHTE